MTHILTLTYTHSPLKRLRDDAPLSGNGQVKLILWEPKSYTVSKLLDQEVSTQMPSPAPLICFLQKYWFLLPLSERKFVFTVLEFSMSRLSPFSLPRSLSVVKSHWKQQSFLHTQHLVVRSPAPLQSWTSIAFVTVAWHLGEFCVNVQIWVIIIKQKKLFPCWDELHCAMIC